ncbi:hypothetical protein ACFOUV_17215 [Oceanobacillus longus]|uniref:Uncharacterized protein n=1 Tax=Oceanobacillus longus TaxID=930120 RepID=A0ABV8H108_9BACI
MNSKIGVLSTVLFFVGLVSYIFVLFGNDSFLIVGVIVSVIGFILALLAEKGMYKKIGLLGNGIILFITIVFPFIVTTFFWNQP